MVSAAEDHDRKRGLIFWWRTAFPLTGKPIPPVKKAGKSPAKVNVC
jgi:hypothetical protein